MNSGKDKAFIETKEYRRFREFCDACLRDCYIGLCYGPLGVGKTLSARHYTRWDKVESYYQAGSSCGIMLNEVVGCDAVFCTVSVINSPGQMRSSIGQLRERLHFLVRRDIERERELQIAEVKSRRLKNSRKNSGAGNAVSWLPVLRKKPYKRSPNSTRNTVRSTGRHKTQLG